MTGDMRERARTGATVRSTPMVVAEGRARPRSDVLVAEEPLEIRVNHGSVDHAISVTMRTPANDFELAVGFLYGEGLIRGRDDVDEVRYCVGGPAEQQYNIVTVALRSGVPFDAESVKRNFYTTSSCGICGKASLEALAIKGNPRVPSGPVVDADVLGTLPATLRKGQKVFERTGGLHAAGLFEPDGELVAVREDVGRHNAVDKVVGWAVPRALDRATTVLLVSGRLSFEVVQKAAVAGIPVVCGISAPTSLAVALARTAGVTLVGFLRGAAMNVYAVAERVHFDD